MRYDERLETVLAQPADQPHDRAVRWRQLVELLAHRGEDGNSELFDQAIAVVKRDLPLVNERVRMAAARAVAPLAAPPELVCALAADRLSVAAPVLAAARLTGADWALVAADASPECRQFIASLRSAPSGDPPVPLPPPAEPERAIPSISEIVARIERLRKARQQSEPEPLPPVPEAAEPPRLFRWECDEAGDIAWVEGVPRGAVIGRSISRGGESGEIESGVGRAFSLRMPFSDARLELAEGSIVGGPWKISGVPAFDPSTGRFSGYHGIAKRDGAQEHPLFGNRDPVSLRELAHELKTPLTAIIGFAEIINGEFFGPAHRPYRERAGNIVEQARLLLTAIDDLDFSARLYADRGTAAATNLAQVIDMVRQELPEAAANFDIAAPATTSLSFALSERLVARFCQAVIAVSGEPQTFTLGQDDKHCILSSANPAPDPGAEPILALRLVLGLARVAGGDLETGRDRLKLLLPGVKLARRTAATYQNRRRGPVAQR